MKELADIRAGNKVLHNASGAAVTVLNIKNDIIELEGFPDSLYCETTDISGIELTDTVLQKLLFSDEEELHKWSGHGISIYKRQDGFYYGLRIGKSRAKIQSLHQLQNYVQDFYALFRGVNYSLNINAL